MINRLVCVFGLLSIFLAITVLQAAPKSDFAQKTYIVKRTRIFTEPTDFGEPMAVLSEGLEVDVLQYTTSAKWTKIRTPNGREGWVLTDVTALAGRREKPLISSKPKERAPSAADDLPIE